MVAVDNPLVGTGINESQAASRIANILNPQGQADGIPANVEDNPAQAEDGQRSRNEHGQFKAKEPDAPAEDAEPDAETLDGQGDEATPEADAKSEDVADDDLEDLPDTLNGLAEAMGMDAKELSAALKATVKVNGEDREVTISEALNGYQRLEDYRIKTAELAESRKADTTERDAIAAERKHYAERLGPFLQQAEQRLSQDDAKLTDMLNPDSTEYNPEGYIREKARLDGERLQVDAARQEQERIRQVEATETHKRFMADVADHEQALVAAVPEWGTDLDLAKKELAEIRNYAVSQGAPKELVDQEFRSYTLLMARDAMLYRRQQEGRPETLKKVRKLPKVLKSGAKRESVDPSVNQHRVNINRLRKTGSIGAAAAALRSGGFLD